MKPKQLIILVLVVCSSACANQAPPPVVAARDTVAAVSIAVPDSFGPGKVIDRVICKADPSQSYALYIPSKGDKEALPIVYFFDPHGDGSLPLNKYKSLADAYGYILVGSNNSKNGTDWQTTDNAWLHLWNDTQQRLKINGQRVYTAGFSGGAKVAGYVALRFPVVKGVIANGAGLPDETPAGNFSFSFTAVAGEGDLNLTDLEAIDYELDKSTTRHRIIFFNGKHEWAPEASMNLAFAGLQFDAMKDATIPKDEAFINGYIEKSKKRLSTDYKEGQLVKAGQECTLSIRLLDGLGAGVDWFRQAAGSVAANALYQKQLQEQQRLLVTEQTTKDEYMQHFQQADMQYWTGVIKGLQAKANAKTIESGMNQRLLAYLSLVFYSLSNRLINGNANSEARNFVELYKMADPGNSEAWYFSALLHARANQAQPAESDLLKAVDCGFRNKDRMMQQPEFQSLSTSINLSKIEDKMASPVKGTY
ncbi:MAG TPA: hypothetical protein VGM41_20970 [Chitinophagaceae bacterium]|jgi:pimeloyl-ACP methyl ester carboxylesterase